MSVRDRPLVELLRYWDGKLYEPSDPPTIVRRDRDSFEALWVTKVDSYQYTVEEDEDGEVVSVGTEQTGTDDAIGYVDHIILTRDTVEFGKYTDRMEWERHSEPSTDDEGRPFFDNWGEDYEYEGVAIDRPEFVNIALRILNGGLQRVTNPRDTFRHEWREVPFKITKKPATPEAWATIAAALCSEIVRNLGSGGDFVSDLPLTMSELRQVMKS